MRRVLAATIDAGLIVVPFAAFSEFAPITALPIAALLVYRVVLHTSLGFTAGKWIMRLRLVDRSSGKKPRFVQVIKRDLWFIVIALIGAAAQLLLRGNLFRSLDAQALVVEGVLATALLLGSALYLVDIARRGYSDGDSFADTRVVSTRIALEWGTVPAIRTTRG